MSSEGLLGDVHLSTLFFISYLQLFNMPVICYVQIHHRKERIAIFLERLNLKLGTPTVSFGTLSHVGQLCRMLPKRNYHSSSWEVVEVVIVVTGKGRVVVAAVQTLLTL